MCGRYTLAKTAEEIEALVGDLVDIPFPVVPRYNIAPSQPVLSILKRRAPEATFTQWGLIPPWAKDPSIGSRLINARAETLAEKPAFRGSFRRCRCLLPADGFYEWQTVPGQRAKQPVYIQLASGEAFALAGLWADWLGADGTELTTSAIVTTEPNELLRGIHNRMPVILPPDAMGTWLHGEDPVELRRLLRPFPADRMKAIPVTPRVNNVRHDAPDCLTPAPLPPRQTEWPFPPA